MRRPQFLRRWWILPVAIVVALIGLLSVFQTSGENRPRLAVRDFVLEVEAGNVTEAELDDGILSYRLDDPRASVFETELAPGDSITNILLDAGIPISEQPRITIDESSGPANIVGLIVNFLPIIIILGIVSFFLRQASRGITVKAVDLPYDPVCKRSVAAGESAGTSSFGNVSYRFCSREHKTQFDENPGGYLHAG